MRHPMAAPDGLTCSDGLPVPRYALADDVHNQNMRPGGVDNDSEKLRTQRNAYATQCIAVLHVCIRYDVLCKALHGCDAHSCC